jgi:hypothetical protein
MMNYGFTSTAEVRVEGVTGSFLSGHCMLSNTSAILAHVV